MPIFVKSLLGALVKMRKLKIDTVIDCELFSRISSILSFLSGAATRVGFHPHTQEGLYRGNFMNRPVPYNPYHHISRQFLTLVEAIGSTTQPKAKRLPADDKLEIPQMNFGPDEIADAKKCLFDKAPEIKAKRIVLIYPGGGLLPIRAWPLDYYCDLAEGLLKQGFAVCVIGLAEDKKVARTILSHTQNENCVDLTGYTKTIRDLMLIFHFSALLITNDGGPGHFAALPLPPNTSEEGFLYAIKDVVLPVLEDFKPDLIVNSAGQDNHYSDPITNMNFSAQGYADLTALLKADIAVLEGGYSIEGALPYVNAGIILAMAGLDYSNIREPDYDPDRIRQSGRVTEQIEATGAEVLKYWTQRSI